jgi:hypothetical protein
VVEGEAEVASAAPSRWSIPTPTCPRCGDYAPVIAQLGRSQCAACWRRMVDSEVGVGAVLGDVKRLAFRLLVPSWLALTAVDSPMTTIGVVYTLRTGEDLPLRATTLYYAVSLIAVGAVMHASHQVLMGEPRAAWRPAWRAGFQRWGAVIVATWLSNLITLLFALLLIVPGVLRLLSYMITTPVTLHEGTDVKTTLERSTELTHGHRWTILRVMLSVIAIGFVPVLLAVMAGGMALGTMSESGELDTSANILINVASEIAMQGPMALVIFATASLYVRLTLHKTRAG